MSEAQGVQCREVRNGTDQELNGDTVFEIVPLQRHSRFVLLDMVKRGEMKLDSRLRITCRRGQGAFAGWKGNHSLQLAAQD